MFSAFKHNPYCFIPGVLNSGHRDWLSSLAPTLQETLQDSGPREPQLRTPALFSTESEMRTLILWYCCSIVLRLRLAASSRPSSSASNRWTRLSNRAAVWEEWGAVGGWTSNPLSSVPVDAAAKIRAGKEFGCLRFKSSSICLSWDKKWKHEW